MSSPDGAPDCQAAKAERIRTMYSAEVVDQIQKLLAAGHSYREIAALTGASHGTVATINHGRTRTYGEVRTVADRAERCRECGNLVFKPCRICEIRRHTDQVLAQRRQEAQSPPGARASRRPAA